MKIILVFLILLSIYAQSGMKLSEIEKNSLYDKIGLKSDDVIENIDGQKITDLNSLMGKLGNLQDGKVHIIEVTRNCKIKKLEYQLKK